MRHRIRQGIFLTAWILYALGLACMLIGFLYLALIIMASGGACFCLGLQQKKGKKNVRFSLSRYGQ